MCATDVHCCIFVEIIQSCGKEASRELASLWFVCCCHMQRVEIWFIHILLTFHASASFIYLPKFSSISWYYYGQLLLVLSEFLSSTSVEHICVYRCLSTLRTNVFIWPNEQIWSMFSILWNCDIFFFFFTIVSDCSGCSLLAQQLFIFSLWLIYCHKYKLYIRLILEKQ